MAKRGGSELHHDNWDKEDEKEDAGSFQSATADEMKGRVIKRARRRNVGEGGAEKKNAFASFGGFGGKPEAPSFSFGPKSGSESSDKPSGFAGFGLSQPAEQKSVFGSPAASFGNSSDAQKPKTPSFGTEAFSFGSKTPSSGGGVGGGAFSLSSGTGGFSFGGGSGDKKETVFGASIKPLPADPAPVSLGTNQEKDVSPLRSDFSAPASTTSFKFGASPAVSAPAPAPAPADTGASLFAFGAAKTASDPPASGFLFGSKTSASSQEPSPAFGLSTNSPSSAFTLGESKPATEKDPEKDKKDLSGSSGFVFGKSSSPARTPSFSFNSEANKSESSKEVSVSSNSGDKPTESRSPASNSKPTSKHSPQYLSHLKALNNQVLAWLKMHIESNPLVILSPVFKDYETHLEELNTKYGPNSSSEEASDPAPLEKTLVVSKEKEPTKVPTEPAKPFSFGGFSAAPTTTTAAASPFSFGSSSSAAAAKVEAPSSASSSAFSFSANSTPASVSSFGAFSFGSGAGASASAPVAQVAPATGDAGDDEDQPPVVEIKQVEETDALYSKKCKLFYKKDGKYTEKGVGMLYLKSVAGNKTQLLVRADTNLGNVLLNILLSSQIPTTRAKNNVMIVCVPNPPINPKDESSEPCPMLLK